MDYPALLLFLVTVMNFMLGIVIYSRNTRSRRYVYYLGLALAVSAWTFTNGLYRVLPVPELLPIALLSYVAAIGTATFFLLFNREFTGIRAVVPDWVILLVGVLVSGLSLEPGLVATAVTPGRAIVTTGGIVPLALLLTAFFVWGLVLLVLSLQRARSAVVRNQTQLILLGMAVGVLAGLFFNLALPIFGVYSYVYLGPDFTLFYLATLAYAIVRQRLFNIKLVVARSIAYVLLLATLAGGYGLVLFGVSGLVFPATQVPLAQDVFNVVLAIVLAFTFQPLRRFFERVTNRVFYRDSYDSQTVLNDFSKVLVSEINLEPLLRHGLTQLCRSLRVQFGQVVVFHHDRVYHIEHYGPLPERLMIVPELQRLNRPLLVADELPDGERKALMDDHGVRVAMALHTRDEFIGYLLLGDKLSGDIYSDQDVELLEIINKELAVAVLNAKAYAEIQAFNVTLQARVDHATNRLRVANRHLKELDRAKDEFISMASHQLRTPLTTIKGYLSMLQEGDAGRLSRSQEEFVGYAFASSERMVNLISDLLNVSRLSAGRFLIQTKPTDMVAMVADEVRQLANHAATKGVALVFERPPKRFGLVELDENKTRQVVMNFIDNAIYYTPAGSVTVRLGRGEGTVRLEVVDTGIGVPEVAKRKLFSKFYRAENAQAVRPDGTGLGLYLARRVVEDQGGTIIFKSVEGRGSTFGFELPLKPVKPAARAKERHG